MKGFYVKTGQVMSTRVDLFPEAYTFKLQQLQDGIKAMPFALVEKGGVTRIVGWRTLIGTLCHLPLITNRSDRPPLRKCIVPLWPCGGGPIATSQCRTEMTRRCGQFETPFQSFAKEFTGRLLYRLFVNWDRAFDEGIGFFGPKRKL